MPEPEPEEPRAIPLRHPTVADAPYVAALAGRCPPLERNSGYAYVLMCSHFAESSVIAKHHGETIGFAFGYLVPSRPDTLFIWQIGVDPSFRGKGAGVLMLRSLIAREALANVRYVEATVGPSNGASLALFQRFAEQTKSAIAIKSGFTSDLFDTPGHEAEDLVRIGPLH